jgi:hypothetical protein
MALQDQLNLDIYYFMLEIQDVIIELIDTLIIPVEVELTRRCQECVAQNEPAGNWRCIHSGYTCTKISRPHVCNLLLRKQGREDF